MMPLGAALVRWLPSVFSKGRLEPALHGLSGKKVERARKLASGLAAAGIQVRVQNQKSFEH